MEVLQEQEVPGDQLVPLGLLDPLAIQVLQVVLLEVHMEVK